MLRAPSTLLRLALAVLAIGLICPPAGFAGGPGVNPDDDFTLLGEFRGPVSVEPNKYEPLALQVRPVGGGNFEAVQYDGGLPGDKTFRGKPVKFIGRRSGDFLALSGGPWIIVVEKDHCLILDRTGQKIGRLERVKRISPTMGAQPPKDASVLFDGKNVDQFTTAKMTPDGLLMEGADMKPIFQDFNLHLEFQLPYMPGSIGQSRANSGVYLQSRYEVQVLDSFAEEPVFNGCGALYRFRKPDVNMCYPPLQWQTYDIIFTAPRWAADGTKLRNARITVWLNGAKVHNNVEVENKTGAGQIEEPLPLPTRLQDHGNPVRYRNVWVIDRGLLSNVKFPIYPPKPAPKPEPKPQPKPEAKPAEKPHPDPAPKPKPEAKPDAKPQAKPEPKTESKPAPKSEPKAEAKPAPKPDAKPEQKPESKPEPKPAPKPDAKSKQEPQSKPAPKEESKPEPKPEPESKPEPKKSEGK